MLRDLVSVLSIVVISANLLFWVLLLIPAVLISAAPVESVRRFSRALVEAIYRAAVWLDSAWLVRVLGVNVRVHGEPPADRSERLLVVSNHRSWFDILVLQHVIVPDGPIARFLIKRNLIFVPIVGWICMALGFPRLHRRGDPESRSEDLSSVERFVLENANEPGAVVSFAEGTRFSENKRVESGSDHAHLLNPRSGGFRVLAENMRESRVLDVTIRYPGPPRSFWRCIDGTLERVEVWLDYGRVANVVDPGAWLVQRWREKDARISAAIEEERDG